MIAGNSSHLSFIDVLRGIAISLVFLIHSVFYAFGAADLEWSGWLRDIHTRPRSFLFFLPLTVGWCGVAIFFVVSGFCIHLSASRHSSPSWRDFFVRRFFRIYPAYLLALLVFAYLFFVELTDISVWERLDHILTHLFMVQNLDTASFYTINPAFWSIAVEMQLYLLYPVLVFLSRRHGWKTTLVLIGSVEILLRAASAIVMCLFSSPFGMSGTPSPTALISGAPFFYWFSWTIGAAIAEAWTKKQPIPFTRFSPWLWAALAIVAYHVKPLAAFSFLLFALATAAYIGRRLQTPQMPSRLPALVTRYLLFVGMISYSIYLLHMPIQARIRSILVQLIGPDAHFLTIFAACCASWLPVLALSYLLYRVVELPGIQVGKWLVDRGVRQSLS